MWMSRRQTSEEVYFLGGRKMPWFLAGVSIIAGMLSTLTFLSTPGEFIGHGVGYFSELLAYFLVIPVVNGIIIPFLMRLPVSSVYDYLERRYGPSVRALGAAIFVLMRLFWMGLIFYTVSFAVNGMTGLAGAVDHRRGGADHGFLHQPGRAGGGHLVRFRAVRAFVRRGPLHSVLCLVQHRNRPGGLVGDLLGRRPRRRAGIQPGFHGAGDAGRHAPGRIPLERLHARLRSDRRPTLLQHSFRRGRKAVGLGLLAVRDRHDGPLDGRRAGLVLLLLTASRDCRFPITSAPWPAARATG